MKTRNRLGFWTSMGLVAALGMMAAMMGPPGATAGPGAKAEIGKAAPDFTLKDVDGKDHKLSEFTGKNLVIESINPQCTVCNRVKSSGLIEKMRKDLKAIDKDFVHLAINSTEGMTAEDSAKYLKKYKLFEELVVLDDAEGAVGKLYGAKTTPHMFVIDAKGVLRYTGALDNDPTGRNDERTNYVVNALRQIVAGETVSPEKTQSYGCEIKYRK